MATMAAAAATAAAARGAYRRLLRIRTRLPGAQVRAQLKHAAAAAFRARRPLYAATRAAAGPEAAEAAARMWLRDAERELRVWTRFVEQPEAVRRNVLQSRVDLPL
jgi:hypothetical protein